MREVLIVVAVLVGAAALGLLGWWFWPAVADWCSLLPGRWLLRRAAWALRHDPGEPDAGIVDWVCGQGQHDDCPAWDCACWCHLPDAEGWEWDDATLAALHDEWPRRLDGILFDADGNIHTSEPPYWAAPTSQAEIDAWRKWFTDLPDPAEDGSDESWPRLAPRGRAGEHHELDWLLDDPYMVVWDAKMCADRCWEILHVEFPRLRAELGLVAA